MDLLASSKYIVAARPDLGLKPKDLVSLDRLDPLLIAKAPIDHRLAARAVIEVGAGDEAFVNLVPDRAGNIARYSFNLPSETSGCHGKIRNGQRLAEEVVVTQQRVTGPVTLNLGPKDIITVEPLDPTKEVVVNILNQTREVLDHGASVMTHPKVHRWLYRLTDRMGQNRVERQLFACRRSNFGPPDCPQRQLFIAKEKRR